MTNRGSDFKSGKRDLKSGQERLQTGAGITDRCRTHGFFRTAQLTFNFSIPTREILEKAVKYVQSLQ